MSDGAESEAATDLDVIEADVTDADAAVASRDAVVARVREHAGQMARGLAVLQGGDYGQETFGTDRGEWTVKYEAGALQYLRFSPRSGDDTYVVSTKQPPEPDDLADAMADYDSLVEAFNDHVERLDGVLDGVREEFPDVASTEAVASERDRVVSQIRAATDAMAGELHRADGGNYGSHAARVDGKRWELKWEDGRTSYLRVGGEGGVYLVSQYGPPSARDVRAHADGFAGFVEAFNDHVRALDADLSTVEL